MKIRLSQLQDIAVFFLVELCFFFHFDHPVSAYVRQLDIDHHDLIDFFRAYTDFGKSFWYLWPFGLGAIGIGLALRFGKMAQPLRDRVAKVGRGLTFLFVTIAVSGIITDCIKPLIGRARPVMMDRENFYGCVPFTFKAAFNSMPSGHATTAFALAFTLGILLPRQRLVWLGIGFALALSRVMVNAHYVSDTIAGMGVAYVTVCGIQKLLAQNGIVHAQQRIFPIDRENPTR